MILSNLSFFSFKFCHIYCHSVKFGKIKVMIELPVQAVLQHSNRPILIVSSFMVILFICGILVKDWYKYTHTFLQPWLFYQYVEY